MHAWSVMGYRFTAAGRLYRHANLTVEVSAVAKVGRAAVFDHCHHRVVGVCDGSSAGN